MGIPLSRHMLGPTLALSAGVVTIVWSSTPGISAATSPELDLGAVTSAEAAQLPGVSHSSQIPITSAFCLQEGLLTPSPAVTLFLLSSSLLSKTLKEILSSPGGRTSGTQFSQLEKWSPANYPWLWYFNLCILCMVTLHAALGACNLDIFQCPLKLNYFTSTVPSSSTRPVSQRMKLAWFDMICSSKFPAGCFLSAYCPLAAYKLIVS